MTQPDHEQTDTETRFPHGATVRDLAAALEKVPDAHRDKTVEVLVKHRGAQWGGPEQCLPAQPDFFEQFPSTLRGPQLEPATYVLYCTEGTNVAAEVESLRELQRFAEHQRAQEDGTL